MKTIKIAVLVALTSSLSAFAATSSSGGTTKSNCQAHASGTLGPNKATKTDASARVVFGKAKQQNSKKPANANR